VKWQVEWGDKVETLNKMRARDGKAPSALANRPEPTLHASTYLSAFNYLSTSRIVTVEGVGSIPVSEILAYADLNRLNGLEDRQDLLFYVQVCDLAYLEALRRKQPKHGSGKHATSRGRLPTRR
jgi:hypothetical protein